MWECEPTTNPVKPLLNRILVAPARFCGDANPVAMQKCKPTWCCASMRDFLTMAII